MISVAAPAAFNGNFATLFPGAFLIGQSDLGVTLGGTMSATGTAPPVITLTGTMSGLTTSITITDTLPGILGTWTGLVTYGDSTTQAFTSAATVPLTGRGSGLTLNIAAGAAAGDNVWVATCSALADQSGNAHPLSQAAAGAQPILAAVLNGKPGLQFNAALSQHIDSAVTLAAPATTNVSLYTVFTPIAKAGQANYFGSNAALSLFSGTGAVNQLTQFCGSAGNTSAALTAAPTRVRTTHTGSVADLLKVGAQSDVTGASSGNAVSTGFTVGAGTNTGIVPANLVLYLVVLCPAMSAAQLAAADAAVNSSAGYGVGAVIL